MAEYGFSLTFIFPYKEKIKEKTEVWHILGSEVFMLFIVVLFLVQRNYLHKFN